MTKRPSVRAEIGSLLSLLLRRKRGWRRRAWLWVAAGGSAILPLKAAGVVTLQSPAHTLKASIGLVGENRLSWWLERDGQPVVLPSPLGITINDKDLGAGVSLGQPVLREINEHYPWRGLKNAATNRCLSVHLPIRHQSSGTDWEIEARVFDDGFAYRYRVPGDGRSRVRSETSMWQFPKDVRAWYQTDTRNYEGVYRGGGLQDVPAEIETDHGKRPVRLGPPVTLELATGGYVLVTEAGLVGYSGFSLRATPAPGLEVVFEDDAEGFEVEGPVVTPWRVTLACTDLNGLMNSDVVRNLAEPPDPRFFPDGALTDWIRPGKALITWCVFGNDGARWHLQKWFVDQCAALRCEYLLVDAGWRSERWGWLANGGDVWARLKELCDYGATRGVGIVVWHSFPEGRDDGPGLTDPAARREFFRRCAEAGVKGVKIDFFDSESKDTVEAYTDLVRLAAEHHLTINFHGANKPTGEMRTWPNEVTREGIREQEYLLWSDLPLEHYATLPFTRLAVGNADFLPTYVREKYLKNTTAVFQMATAFLATTSFLCWPDHPDDYLASPFLGLIQALPLTWDSTLVLPQSRIGRQVGLVRRSGDTWFIALLNCNAEPIEWETSLEFIGDQPLLGTVYQDAEPGPKGVAIETGRPFTKADVLKVHLKSGGAFVAWLKPDVRP